MADSVEKDAFVLPVLPKSLRLDPVLAALLHLTSFLELSGDETVDPDWAVEALEHVGHYLQQLSAEQRVAIRDQSTRVAEFARKKKWSTDVQQFFEDFLENFGLDEGGDE